MTGARTKRVSVLLAVIALALFGLAACGDDDDDGGGEETTAVEETATAEATGGAGATIEVSAPADGTLAYDQSDLQTTAGPNTLAFENPASLSHDVVIEDESGGEVGRTDLISESETSTSVDLQPGTYTYYCSVPGHREGGMEGTLTVN